MILSAEFLEHEALESALESLVKGGAKPDAIELFSSRPVELKPGLLDRPSRMSLSSVAAAAIVGIGFTAFMLWAQLDYPLVTGGMPILSGWPIGVVIFEITMAGAVAGIMLAFLHEGGFAESHELAAPPSAGLDCVVLRLECSDEDAEQAESRLRGAGAANIERLA